MPRHVDSIKCGSCKERHTTVAQVQLCYQAKAKAADLTRREEFDAQVARQADEAELMRELAAERDESGDPAAAAMLDAYAAHFHPGVFDECRVDHRADPEEQIAAQKAATLELYARWQAANPGRQLNKYGCVPYSRCNCPVSYRMCSGFGVLDRFGVTEAVAASFSPGGASHQAPRQAAGGPAADSRYGPPAR